MVLFALVVLWAAARAAITVCVAEVKNGKLIVTRGALAPRVLDDLRDIVKRPRVRSATLRVVRAKDKARIEVRGNVGEAQLQRLRNVIGNTPLAQLTRKTRKG